MRVAFGDRLVGVEPGLQLLVHRLLRLAVHGLGELPDVGLLAGLGDGVADDVLDALLGRPGRDREFLVVAVRGAPGRTGCGSRD